jgi:hypothetical protein
MELVEGKVDYNQKDATGKIMSKYVLNCLSLLGMLQHIWLSTELDV